MRIGLLGAARITPKAIIEPGAVMPEVTVAAIAARDQARADAFAAQHHIDKVHADYAALLADPDIDLIYNALPVNMHAPWSIRALEAGKHVLCEKPFAMNLREAEEMQIAAKKADRRLIEAFHHLYHPAWNQVLDVVTAGQIGAIRDIKAHFNVGIRNTDDEIRRLPETGGGAMMDLGCYPLCWVLTMMVEDPLELTVTAVQTDRGVDETMTVDMVFRTDVKARIDTTMAEGTPFSAGLTLVGERGRIEMDNPVHPQRGGSVAITRGEETTRLLVNPISSYTFQLAAVYFAVTHGAPVPTEGPATLRQQTWLDRIYEAAGLGDLRRGS